MLDSFLANTLAKVRHLVEAETVRRQRPNMARLRGKTVMRAGKLFAVKLASRRQVKLKDLTTERQVSMSAKAFLSRAVVIVTDPPGFDRKLTPISIAERALAWARGNELDQATRIRQILKLRREAEKGSDDENACTWYLGQIKRGEWPIVVYKPAA